MHADISRITFRPDRHYSAVIAQQGRVQLDADANEQAAIQLLQARTTAADLIGQHGGPAGATGFALAFVGGGRELDDLSIGAGRYYVDGILLDATRPQPGVPVVDDGHAAEDADEDAPPADAQPPATWTYWDQPDGYRDPERPGDRLPTQFPYLAYLKVWERSVTAAEDPLLREVALGSAMPDTAARLKTVWQVLPLPGSQLEVEDGASKDQVRAAFAKWAAAQAPTARMAARSERPEHADEDPCLVKPDARYRGPENQMYRVEIHEGGGAKDATFKWSRENGSVTFPVDELDGTWVELASLGSDDKLDLNVGDLVEFVDTAYTSRGEPLPLLRVEEVDLPGRRVRLSGEPDSSVGRRPGLHPFLRRWDHRSGSRHTSGSGRTKQGAAKLRHGAVRIEEGGWLPLEDGVLVYFEPGRTYRTGDFWTVPARTATGNVEWPTDAARRPLLQAPAGIQVHYAPLAWVLGEGSTPDLRMTFAPLAAVIPAANEAELAAEATAEAEALAAETAAAAGSGARTAGQDDEGQPAH
ncbi:hypothetical protein HRW18_05045 [Streptomyces lunaelactis]|uniref:DUF6519 domain-containing protein n=1 Tax=Streptomyces lunaelactis TaxID=1535768 RepID=UPI0015848148|nr:DUF6519 domain-containing protein [Streptomyces lunaelactis]NUK00859.1 hypothetical protein [Streptomyces lunaelactis]NUK07390.1 hypothetical protein [Streptomyces lunaelactis]NUK14784.1 hypothetical protein [Streptomyces lunaelactis]NUK22166.1 hypothetical protein [Streptomyces lunaelactis]NUK34181.1 hypothetical protein [Streptomyces lunaelactis]